ncbi:MAG: hypothetical protein ABEJ95_00625 [Candidatus Nanohalobium sp.]
MDGARDSVVFALLAVVLISIPAASQSVEIKERSDLHGVIDSRFSDRFEVEFEPGKVVMSILGSSSKLSSNVSYRRNISVLRTPQGFIKKKRTSNYSITVVQTPYGRFKTGFRDGENISGFEGEAKEKAEEVRKILRKKFRSRMSEARKRKQMVVSSMLPDVELDVVARNDTVEHFTLSNTGDKKVDMDEWKVKTVDSEGVIKEVLKLERSIGTGEETVFYSSSREELESVGIEPESSAVVESGLNILNGGGEVRLYNENDRLVDSYSY